MLRMANCNRDLDDGQLIPWSSYQSRSQGGHLKWNFIFIDCIALAKQGDNALGSVGHTETHTDGQTDTTKCIISLPR